MLKKDLERVVVKYYQALDEGKILGRKCTKCGHIEFPPYLACNTCGNLDTEWVEMGDEATCTQILAAPAAFMEPDLKERVGDYWHGAIHFPDTDPIGDIIINVNPEKLEEARSRLPIKVRPVITQEYDTKAVFWEPVSEDLQMEPVIKKVITQGMLDEIEETPAPASTAESAAPAMDIDPTDPVALAVLECAAEAYDADVDDLTLDTDIREDLSSESMKMIVMISGIEDELDVTIEIKEAGNLNTLADFVRKVKEKME